MIAFLEYQYSTVQLNEHFMWQGKQFCIVYLLFKDEAQTALFKDPVRTSQ